jgi:hypothetical protein
MGLFRFYIKNKLRRSDTIIDNGRVYLRIIQLRRSDIIIVIDRFVSESFSSVGAILFYPFK